MRAAVMMAVGQPLTIEDVEIADPGPGEVVVDVVAAGLCHSDLHFIDGSFPHPLPAILGHEAAGVVREVGDGVTAVSPEDHVVMSISVFCGRCALCRAGKTHLCVGKAETRRNSDQPPRLSMRGSPVAQFLDLSAFAEQMLVHENAVVRIDEDVPFDHAAILGCGVATGLGAVFNTALVQPGQSVVVIGCGGVGLSAVQGARIAGGNPIIAVDRMPVKLDLARQLGATDGVDSADPDLVSRVRNLTDSLGAHHVIEAVGSVATIEQSFAMTRRGGTVTVVGLVPSGSVVEVPTDDLFYERKLQGSVMGSNDFKVDVSRYLGLLADGQLQLDEMVAERIDLDDINGGFDRMRAGIGTRNLVVFSDS